MKKSSFGDQTMVNRANNVKKIMELEHINQKKLADLLGVTPQYLSRILTQKVITESTWEGLHVAFPQYRMEWLLGLDDYPTEQEYNERALADLSKKADTKRSKALTTAYYLAEMKNINLRAVGESNEYIIFKIQADVSQGYIAYSDIDMLINDLTSIS